MLAVLLLFAVATAAVALLEGSGVMALPYDMLLVDLAAPGLFRLHMLASGSALLLMPIVLALRHKPKWHKQVGRVAAIAVVVGGLTALPVAIVGHSAPLARAGLFMQGIVWLGLIGAGYAAIRNRQRDAHRKYMLAMVAVASGALWVRLVTAVATAWRLPFDEVYSVICWAGWMLPLFAMLALWSVPKSHRGMVRQPFGSA